MTDYKDHEGHNNAAPYDVAVSREGEPVDDTQYTADAPNAINALFYGSCPDAFAPEGGIATLYSAERSVQLAVGAEIGKVVAGKPDVRIKEISSGSTTARWENIPQGMPEARRIHITLSDFSENGLPNVQSLDQLKSRDSRLTFSTEEENFFKPMADLPAGERHDVILGSYSFDSVWLEGDHTVQKVDGEWAEHRHHITVSGDDETSERLAEGLKKGDSPDGESFRVEDFKRVSMDTRVIPTDVSQLPYGREAMARYDRGRNSTAPINIPGGLVDKVNEAFLTQLKPDGAMVICDVAVNDPRGISGGDFNERTMQFEQPRIMDTRNTGPVAKYKTMDFGLAADILSRQGYDVSVRQLGDIMAEHGQSIPSNLVDQQMMIVRKA